MSKAIIRKAAPFFKGMAWMPNKEFKQIDLNLYKGKYLVLFFWPLDFTFVCPTQIVAFSNKYKEFKEVGAEVIGCSVDSQFTHMEFTEKPRKSGGLGDMEFPLLSDLSKQISKDYGCLIEDGNDTGVSFRATFIIDTKGILRHISMNDLPVGRNPDEVLRLVKAFKYTDQHGEVCPASWKPGDKTMVPKVGSTKNKEFFEKQ